MAKHMAGTMDHRRRRPRRACGGTEEPIPSGSWSAAGSQLQADVIAIEHFESRADEAKLGCRHRGWPSEWLRRRRDRACDLAIHQLWGWTRLQLALAVCARHVSRCYMNASAPPRHLGCFEESLTAAWISLCESISYTIQFTPTAAGAPSIWAGKWETST